MIELLSPAGEINSFKAAIENGANAIYMGVSSYNARAMASNFSIEEYIECIKYAHIRNVKVYLTLNTLLYTNEIENAMKILIQLYSHGLDAVILQDIGMANIVHKILPDLEMHASTQMSIHNLKQVEFMKSIGFKRVVLSRESTLEEIEYICKNTDVEIEVFVHGALCVSYSGQCLMSSMIGARSGNRGKCAGPCRLKYTLLENGNNEIVSNKYLISKKDIFGIDYVDKLIDAGVTSLKIEGRSKTSEYVSLVTSKYRKAIDEKITLEDRKELKQIFLRTSESLGYLDKVDTKDSISYNSAKNTGLKLGTVLEIKDKFIKVKLEEDIDMHDGIELYNEDEVTASTIVTCIKDENLRIVNHTKYIHDTVWLGDINKKVNVGDIIYKTSSNELNEKYSIKNFKVNVKNNITANINIVENKSISLEINGNIYEVEYIPQIANNKLVDEEYINAQFTKTVDSPFEFDLKYNIGNNLFVPVSKLNELRRIAIKALEDSYEINKDVSQNIISFDKYLSNAFNVGAFRTIKKSSLFIYKYNKLNEELYLKENKDVIYISISDISKDISILNKHLLTKEVYVYIPNVVLKNLDNYITSELENVIKLGVKGILIGNLGYLDICLKLKEMYNLTLVADYSLNIVNIHSIKFLKEYGIDIITISPEIDESEIANLNLVSNIEVISNYVTVMTTRFCPVKSYTGKCNCNLNNYDLKDNFNNVKYSVICDTSDCIVKLVRNVSNLEEDIYSLRKSIL